MIVATRVPRWVRDVEDEAERLFAPAERGAAEQQVRRARDRQELGDALHGAQERGDQIDMGRRPVWTESSRLVGERQARRPTSRR